jgi:periplasmic protein TonB
MREPLSRFFAPLQPSTDTWFVRVKENLVQVLHSPPLFPSSANGAPIHVLKFNRTATANRAQTASLLTHAAVFAVILLFGAQARVTRIGGDKRGTAHRPLTYIRPPDTTALGSPSLGRSSGGGEEDPRPARHGLLAPGASIPLAPPRRTVNPNPELAVPVAVLDPNAPQFPPPVNSLGIPWMKEDTDSAGPGKNHGFGAGKNGGMGDDAGPGAGQGNEYGGPYANVASLPRCGYCPDPQYTDEAREAKLQGTVTLQVLVGADGRAAQIRIVRGIGLGLDERAEQSVRGWKFIPARDPGRRAVPAWVTVEAVFRLF